MANEDLCKWMEENCVLCGITALCIAAVPVYLFLSRRRNLPPGPSSWPLLGTFPLIARMGGGPKLDTFYKWLHEKYGPVALFYLGPYPTVLVSGFEALQEAFENQAEATIDRPAYVPGAKAMGLAEGVASSTFDTWKKYRGVTHLGIQTMAQNRGYNGILVQEVKQVIEDFRKTTEKPFEPLNTLTDFFIAIRLSMLLGIRVNKDDEIFQKMQKFQHSMVHNPGSLSPQGTIPLLRFISTPFKEFIHWVKVIKDEFRREVDESKKTFDPNQIDSSVDVYLKLQKEKPDSGILDEGIAVCCDEQMAAGCTGLARTTEWVLYYLTQYPDIQEKCHSEVYNKVGKFRHIGLDDLKRFPYVQAVLYETLRFVSPVWTSIPHATTKDMKLMGYNIPKRTIMLGNLWSANHDEAEWTTPGEFNPERFLKSDGTLDDLPRAFIPHGIGPRYCPGFELAVKEMSVLLASVVQNFRLMEDPDANTKSVFIKFGAAARPASVIAKHR